MNNVPKGEQLIKKGDKVTHVLLERFKPYKNIKSQQNLYSDFLENLPYRLVVSFILIIITFAYFYSLKSVIIFSNQKIGIVAAIIIISLFFVYFSLKGFSILCIIPSNFVTCIIPLAITSILLSVLIVSRGAIFASLLVSLVTLAVYKSETYKDFFIRSVIAVPIVLVSVEILCLIRFIISEPNEIYTLIFLSLTNGAVCGIISLAFLFVIEAVFHVSTNMNLLSRCDYNHPLLQRLPMEEAPGIYHHSLIVATLAEQAANE